MAGGIDKNSSVGVTLNEPKSPAGTVNGMATKPWLFDSVVLPALIRPSNAGFEGVLWTVVIEPPAEANTQGWMVVLCEAPLKIAGD